MRNEHLLDTYYKQCEEVMKHYSKSFYTAFSMLPYDKARAVYAIYAFCRISDDIIDSNFDKEYKIKEINKLQDSIKSLFNEGSLIDNDSFFWYCLKDSNERFNLDINAFLLQLEGQLSDLNFKQPKSLEELETYCYQVASSVGLMMLPIIATKHYASLNEVANHLGIALQLTNILRDIGEDYHIHNRIYLPIDLMSKYGVKEVDIKNRNITEAFKLLWDEIASKAKYHYQYFFDNADLFDKDSILPLYAAALIYKEILTVIENKDYDCLNKKQYVSKQRKLLIINRLRRNGVI